MFKIINNPKCPEAKSQSIILEGFHNCFKEGCYDNLPKENIFTLSNSSQKSKELYEKGIISIREIPGDYKLTGKQTIQKQCALNKEVHVDKEGINLFLKTLQYPLYYLDFETYSLAVPKIDGTKPYQKIPFQYSLHVVKEEGSKAEHFSFLADGGDPRTKFLSELKKMLGDSGSIVVYNQSFEKGVLKELAETFPEYKEWVNLVVNRVVDLIIPFGNFSYYNSIQDGSASLKKVLPALTGKGYDNMDIDNGEDASLGYLEMGTKDLLEDRKCKIREDLEKYCGLDTEAMVWIVDELRRLI